MTTWQGRGVKIKSHAGQQLARLQSCEGAMARTDKQSKTEPKSPQPSQEQAYSVGQDHATRTRTMLRGLERSMPNRGDGASHMTAHGSDHVRPCSTHSQDLRGCVPFLIAEQLTLRKWVCGWASGAKILVFTSFRHNGRYSLSNLVHRLYRPCRYVLHGQTWPLPNGRSLQDPPPPSVLAPTMT
jgi:hypothetical protein